jgi:hypothetical protein
MVSLAQRRRLRRVPLLDSIPFIFKYPMSNLRQNIEFHKQPFFKMTRLLRHLFSHSKFDVGRSMFDVHKVIEQIMVDQNLPHGKSPGFAKASDFALRATTGQDDPASKRQVFMIFLCILASWRENLIISP